MQELEFKAKMFHNSGSVSVLDGDVCKSDTLASSELRQSLVEAVKYLEDADPLDRDWHPDSDEQVLNLVHPSLFPLIYGRSRILTSGVTDINKIVERSTEGVLISKPNADEISRIENTSSSLSDIENSWSTNFQWLPCNVGFSDNGKEVRYVLNGLDLIS
jgi:hypothetical protein